MFVVSTKHRKQPARTAAPRYQTELRPERRMRMRVASAWVLTCVVLRPAMHMRWRDGRSAQGARDWEGSCDRGGGVGRLVPAVHASRTQPYMTKVTGTPRYPGGKENLALFDISACHHGQEAIYQRRTICLILARHALFTACVIMTNETSTGRGEVIRRFRKPNLLRRTNQVGRLPDRSYKLPTAPKV